MGTKRRIYRESRTEELPDIPDQQETEVGMRDMLIGVTIVIVILTIAFFSPNF